VLQERCTGVTKALQGNQTLNLPRDTLRLRLHSADTLSLVGSVACYKCYKSVSMMLQEQSAGQIQTLDLPLYTLRLSLALQGCYKSVTRVLR
jgi:hypothetical protein